MTHLRLIVLTFGLLGGLGCGASPSGGSNNSSGNPCLCHVNRGPGYDACVENPDYGCDCSMGGASPTLEPPCT